MSDIIQIFKNAEVLTPNGELAKSHVYVQHGRILHVTQNADTHAIQSESVYREIDCNGYALLPACIDINVSPLDKKLGAKSIDMLAKKALQGGIATIFLNPYTQPSITNEAINALIESINTHSNVRIYPLIASTNDDGTLSDIDTLSQFSSNARAIFCHSAIGSNLLYQTMQYAKMLHLPLCVFAFDFNIEQGVAYESAFARELGLPMITPIGQIKEVAKIKEMAKFLGIEVLFMSMNIAHAIDMIHNEKGLYAQVALPHLIFNEQNIKNYDTRYKMIPPLLTRSKKEKLIKRLKEGKIALLTSMQQDISKQHREQVFEDAQAGVGGIEYFFSLAYSTLVKEGILPLHKLIELTSTNASTLMGLHNGSIEAGKNADFMVIDLNKSYVVHDEGSLYHGMELYGVMKYMVVNGAVQAL